jgi:hypothetical protein
MPDTTVDELRQAAARLREQAKAAQEATHPGHGEWQPWGVVQNTRWEDFPEPQPVPDDGPFGTGGTVLTHGHHVPTGEAFVTHARYVHDQEEDWFEAESLAGPMPEDLAVYFAGMHPGVALAVADLLDKIAWMGEVDPELLGRVGCDEAVAIARAYLGKEDGNG